MVTFSVSTTNNALIGVYTVAIKAILSTATTTAWTGTKPSATWSYFTVTIVDPCASTAMNNCKYTKLIAPT